MGIVGRLRSFIDIRDVYNEYARLRTGTYTKTIDGQSMLAFIHQHYSNELNHEAGGKVYPMEATHLGKTAASQIYEQYLDRLKLDTLRDAALALQHNEQLLRNPATLDNEKQRIKLEISNLKTFVMMTLNPSDKQYAEAGVREGLFNMSSVTNEKGPVIPVRKDVPSSADYPGSSESNTAVKEQGPAISDGNNQWRSVKHNEVDASKKVADFKSFLGEHRNKSTEPAKEPDSPKP